MLCTDVYAHARYCLQYAFLLHAHLLLLDNSYYCHALLTSTASRHRVCNPNVDNPIVQGQSLLELLVKATATTALSRITPTIVTFTAAIEAMQPPTIGGVSTGQAVYALISTSRARAEYVRAALVLHHVPVQA